MKRSIICLFWVANLFHTAAQKKIFADLDEALRHPEQVYALELGNQTRLDLLNTTLEFWK
jgi:hypothetical protein